MIRPKLNMLHIYVTREKELLVITHVTNTRPVLVEIQFICLYLCTPATAIQ